MESGALTDSSLRLILTRIEIPNAALKVEVAVLVILVRRNRCAVGAAVRRAVGVKVLGAVEEETGPAVVRHVPQAFRMSLFLYWI